MGRSRIREYSAMLPYKEYESSSTLLRSRYLPGEANTTLQMEVLAIVKLARASLGDLESPKAWAKKRYVQPIS